MFSNWGVFAWSNLAWRFIQFIFGITVIGLYAQDLHHAAEAHKYSDSKWVFAVVVSTLASFTALILMISSFLNRQAFTAYFFGWEWVLFILWAALSGVFGAMYMNVNLQDGQDGIVRMHNAVIIDLINMCLWFISAIAMTYVFWSQVIRGNRSMHTGRAKV